MDRSPYVVDETAEPQIGGNDNAGPTEWLPQLTVREEVNRIIKDVVRAAGSGVTVADVMGRSRYREIVVLRHKALAEVYLAFPWMSYPQLGRLFRLDHSTCMHALRKLGVWKPRLLGCSGRHIDARLYAQDIDYLFVRIGAALSASETSEGANNDRT